jgi:hypothetical protein
VEKLPGGWVEHSPRLHLPRARGGVPRHRGNAYCVVGNVVEKVDGPIDGVDNPGNPGGGLLNLTFFTQETITRAKLMRRV